MRKLTLVVSASLLLAGAPAFAQEPVPASAAQPLGGPQVSGVCLLSQQAVLANAKVGQAATARLRGLAQKVDANLVAERQPLVADAKALQAQQASLKPADLAARRQALAARVQGLERTAEERRRQIELTREKALARIATEAQPVIAQVYKAHGCGLLIDRNTVLGGNMGGDLTAAVVQGLNARMTTISFDLAPLPAATQTTKR